MRLWEWIRKRRNPPDKIPTDWQKIFLASKANGGLYAEPPPYHWFDLPKDTWLQKKMEDRDGREL